MRQEGSRKEEERIGKGRRARDESEGERKRRRREYEGESEGEDEAEGVRRREGRKGRRGIYLSAAA